MAIRNDFTAGEVLAAADLNDTFASKVPFSYGTATPSTTVDGFVWYDENETPPAPKFWDGAAFQALGGGKVLQVVRATDTTNRSTTSTSYVDVTGMSVTITPQKSTSAILIIAAFLANVGSSNRANDLADFQITDSSNNAISGAQAMRIQNVSAIDGADGHGIATAQTLFAYATPATVSAVTYKLRFKVGNANTGAISQNALSTGQMYAIEVSA